MRGVTFHEKLSVMLVSEVATYVVLKLKELKLYVQPNRIVRGLYRGSQFCPHVPVSRCLCSSNSFNNVNITD